MANPAVFEKMDLFYLGRELDPDSGATLSIPLLYKNKYLTTHAAIIGMTGSGKTGLGIGLLEEAALDRLPAIVIDPKGDMGNLLLTFPELQPDDFEPWIDATRAEQKGMTVEELAADTAETWEKGIASWEQDKSRIARLRENVDLALYTPGSSSGRPVSVLDSLDAPGENVLEDDDTVASLVNSSVSSILGLLGIQADPLKSREHILLSSILLHHWREQKNVDLEILISSVVNPSFDRIGVFPLESFYPQAKRMDLAMQLNNIIASPSFSGWTQGEPLNIEDLLYTSTGKPRVSIFSIAHLNDSERMFFVTMLLGRLIGWMRQQEGSSGLRCLLYMDEIFGYFPPSANPPSKKPMLLLLKQARAYGLGVILATQNPVDLDYKGLANIGTWFVGRLQTKQDQNRVMTGIAGSSAKLESERIRQLLANMRGRTFLMHSTHLDEPVLFETRWVLSYLKGPISLSEVSRLISGRTDDDDKVQSGTSTADIAAPTAGKYSASPPLLPDTIEQGFVPPPLPMEEVKYVPWLAGSAAVRFYNQSRGIDQVEQTSLRIPLDKTYMGYDWGEAVLNPVDHKDIVSRASLRAQYLKLPPDFSTLKNLNEPTKSLSDYLYHSKRLLLLRVPALNIESKPGEPESQFQGRIADLLREKKETELRKLEEKFKSKQQVLQHRLEKAMDKIEKEKGDVKAKGVDTALSFGIAVFGALFGRKALSVSTASRSAQGVRSAGRLMKEKEDVRRAEEELERMKADLTVLAEQFQEKATEVTEKYALGNYPAETFPIKPRRTDIFDVVVYVQWEPVLEFSGVEPGE